MINDTILNFRQKKIVNLLEDKDGLSRFEILNKIELKKKISRITQIRDLNVLIDKGFVVTKGKGRATKYYLAQKNPLLRYVELNQYFETDIFERDSKESFDSGVFKHLSNLS